MMKKGERENQTECAAIAALLDRYAAADLRARDERRVWEHLGECATCRAMRAGAADPGALFAALRSHPLPESHWTGFMDRLRERTAWEAAPERRGWRRAWGDMLRYPRLAYIAAPLAMVLVLGATLFVMRPGSREWLGRVGRQEAIRSPYDRPPGTRSQSPQVVRPGQPPPVLPLPLDRVDAGGPPALEEVFSPGARVYRFDVGGGDDESPIYLVVDESIDF